MPSGRWLAARFLSPSPVPAGRRGRYELELHVRASLRAGAAIRVSIPLGSTPPTLDEGPGQVTWHASGRALVLGEIVRRRHLQLSLTGGRLEPGEAIVVVYGGADGATLHPWRTDDAASFVIAVDPLGTGTFETDDVACLPLAPGPPAHLHVVVPSATGLARPVAARVNVLDAFGNLCDDVDTGAEVRVEAAGARRTKVDVRGGQARTAMLLNSAGVQRLSVEAPALGLAGRSNPCRVGDADGAGPLWGDPHVHTRVSDGAGSPEFALRYARSVSLLDFTAITDHDIEHYHPWFLHATQRMSDEEWAHLGELIRRERQSGGFAVLRGYEWTGRPHGDKCIYFRSDAGALRRYEPGDAESPAALFAALRSGASPALAVPHTPASNFMGTDWDAHDADLQRLVEVYSMHGASEFEGCPLEMVKTVRGRHVQDALLRGYRLGFVAAGDMHSSQPGNPILGFGPYRTLRHKAGITAVFAADLTEGAIFDALHARRTYATTGARILLDFAVTGVAMGQEGHVAAGDPIVATAAAHGTDALKELTIVRNGKPAMVEHLDGEHDFTLTWRDSSPRDDRAVYYYLRVTQRDGEMAWSSPVWVTCTGPS
jgi:Protein of unknown function (DUF3604)